MIIKMTISLLDFQLYLNLKKIKHWEKFDPFHYEINGKTYDLILKNNYGLL